MPILHASEVKPYENAEPIAVSSRLLGCLAAFRDGPQPLSIAHKRNGATVRAHGGRERDVGGVKAQKLGRRGVE